MSSRQNYLLARIAGSGLHTFVLFLGPHIVRVANAAVTHRSTAFSGKITSYFTWPESWFDVEALSSAFSPVYAGDAWQVHRCVPHPHF